MRIAASLLLVCQLLCTGCTGKQSSGLVEKVHAKVNETVSALEMKDLHLFITEKELAFNQMPDQKAIMDYAKKENPKLHKLLDSGAIVLTGITQREGVWAYEKDAPSKGGWVITHTGESKMTADELKQRLGN